MNLNTVTGDGTVKEIISSANFQIDNMVSYKTGVASEAVKSTVVKGTCNSSQ